MASDDREARLRRFIGAVACLATVALGLAVRGILTGPTPPLWTMVGFALLEAVAVYASVSFRIGANQISFNWTDTACLLGVVLLPSGWMIAGVFVGVLLAKIAQRVTVEKAVFNTAKAVLATGAATLAGHTIAVDDRWLTSWRGLAALLITAAVFSGISELSVACVAALASGRPIRDVLTAGGYVRIANLIGNYAAGFATVAVLSIDHRMLVVVPPLVLCLHLLYSIQLRTRAERETWQRIATATDRFSDVDLESVLRTAVTSAAALFSADEVEILVRLGNEPAGLVRGTEKNVTWAGPAADAPPGRTAQTAAVPIGPQRTEHETTGTGPGPEPDHPDEPEHVGELRLRFDGKVRFTERERYALHTFAAALGTALRNAYAYAQAQRLAARNAYDAAHDPLTGLANRRQLFSYGAEVLANRPSRGINALVLIDLDHFKEVNDTLGHSAGDQVLIAIGRRFATAAGEDDLVVRLGGDEFAVLFVNLPAPALAMHRARQMLATLDPPIEVDGIRIHASGSGGVATAPAQGGIEELLRRADVAMYQAKREGMRVTQYARSRDTADVARLALGGDLRAALDEDQFAVRFQPLVDLATGRAVGAEALTRWRHPHRGNLNPQRFLTAIEQSGMLPAFAEVVLTEALTAAQSWQAAGHRIGVSINVSPRSLLDPTYPQLVERRLRNFDVPTEHITLELTESLTLSRLDVVDEVLTALRELGLRIALDDFGTGYSSLSMLARVPVHELKIDRSFVTGMDSSPEAAAVVRSTIDLGRSLNLNVVAEGVEAQPQRALLFELGCPIGQGHLFSRAIAPERLLAVLDRGGELAPPLSSDAQVIRIPPTRLLRGHRL